MQLSPAYKATVKNILKALPETLDGIFDERIGKDQGSDKVVCVVDSEAFYTKPKSEAVSLYHHILLLRDDIRYHCQYNGPGFDDLNRYVRVHYGKLHMRLRNEFFKHGEPDWSKLKSVESAGIIVTYNKKSDSLNFMFQEGTLSV